MNFDSKSKEDLIQELKKMQLEKEEIEKKIKEYEDFPDFHGLAQYTINNFHDSIFWIGKNGSFLFVNDSACKNLGYSKEEFLNMGVSDIDPTYPKEKILNAWDNIKDHGLVIFETTHTRKDGKTIPVEITGDFVTYNGKTYNCVFARDISERKKVEEELRKTVVKHNKMITNLGDVITIIDKDGIIKYKSPNVEKLSGWNPEDLVGEPVWDNIHSEDLNSVKRYFASLMKKHNELDAIELRYRCKDGEYKWIKYTGVNLIDDPDIHGILGNYHDITERKIVQQSLIESETRFKALHNASFGGIVVHDKGLILECNQGLSEITGYSIDELIGMNGLLLINEKSRDFVIDKIQSGYEKPYEAVGLRKNGEEFPLRLEARNIPYKGKMVRTVEFRDITEQKNAERALKESEQKFKDLANLLPQTIFETDVNMNITFFNKHALEDYGFSNEKMVNNINVLELLAPEEQKRAKQNFGISLKGEHKTNNEYVALKKDGTRFPVIVYSSPIIKDNKPAGIRGISFNITDIKEAEEELQKQNSTLEAQYEEYMQLNEVLRQTNYDLELAREKAEESNKAKSIFLANMSHELRTPLFGMLGYSDLLMNLLEDKELLEMAAGINRTGKRLLNTLSLILDLSRMESDNFEVNTGKHECVDILKEVFENLKGGALTKNLEYSFLPHTKELFINTDPEMFRIIFENLVGNAIKFTSEGSVILSTEVINKNIFSIKVSDTGIGIDKEDIPIVFEQFKQLSEGTTKNFQGSGLGLSITKKLVELLNGSIEISSEKGIGTTVVVNVPVK